MALMNGRPHGHHGAKAAVHHVHVRQLRARPLQERDFRAQREQVGGDHTDADRRRGGPQQFETLEFCHAFPREMTELEDRSWKLEDSRVLT